jgi:hypothetical protein
MTSQSIEQSKTGNSSAVMPLSTTPPSPAIGLLDLPDELVTQIASHLYTKKTNANWYDRFERHDYFRKGMRKDALSFSACCKELRRVVFHEWMLLEVSVRCTKEELETFSSMPKSVRCHIR